MAQQMYKELAQSQTDTTEIWHQILDHMHYLTLPSFMKRYGASTRTATDMAFLLVTQIRTGSLVLAVESRERNKSSGVGDPARLGFKDSEGVDIISKADKAESPTILIIAQLTKYRVYRVARKGDKYECSPVDELDEGRSRDICDETDAEWLDRFLKKVAVDVKKGDCRDPVAQ